MSLVKALYDYQGDPSIPSLSLQEGQKLTVSNWEVENGWCEATNSQGEFGFIPASYVVPWPPVLPAAPGPPPSAPPSVPMDSVPEEIEENWDSDWDDDSWDDPEPGEAPTSKRQDEGNQEEGVPRLHLKQKLQKLTNSTSLSPSISNLPTQVLYSRSKVSYFGGLVEVPVPDTERVQIVHGVSRDFVWKTDHQPYTVTIEGTDMDYRYHGLKCSVVYKLTPSFYAGHVFRRYKQFSWLRERLVEKFPMIAIPGLPDPQLKGHLKEELIEKRRIQFQEFTNWMCGHPVLSHCDVWMHFLLAKDKGDFEEGKKRAEKDPLVGSMFCGAITVPEGVLLPAQVEGPVMLCHRYVAAMSAAMRNLSVISAEQTKASQVTQLRTDFQRTGQGFVQLSLAMDIDERRTRSEKSLSKAVGQMAEIYIEIGQMFEDQPKSYWNPLFDRLHVYKGILGSFPVVLGEHKQATQIRKESERQVAQNTLTQEQLQEVYRRTDVMSYAVLAEMSHFRDQRDSHFKETLREFVRNQIKFYRNIIERLEVAEGYFD